MLLEFLEEENIPFRLEGKIVVDTDVNKLSSLEERATQLSMKDVKVLEKSDLLNKKIKDDRSKQNIKTKISQQLIIESRSNFHFELEL